MDQVLVEEPMKRSTCPSCFGTGVKYWPVGEDSEGNTIMAPRRCTRCSGRRTVPVPADVPIGLVFAT